MAEQKRREIPPGTLDMLILRTLARLGVLHGFEIAEAIEQESEEVLQVEEGSLYPALQRMMIKGWLVGEWGRTPDNRRARYYHLNNAGRKHLRREMENYREVSDAIVRVLRPSEG